MEKNKAREKGQDLIATFHNYFLNGNTAGVKSEEKELLEIAKYHSLSALYMGHALSDRIDSPKMRVAQVSICRNDALNYEYQEITEFMETHKIWYMPLKGIILQHYYPECWMREMADIDILYDTVHFDELKAFMTERGYNLSIREGSNCDSYTMADMYHFEMHKRLFDPGTVWFGYFRQLVTKAKLVEGKKYEYQLSKEDFYIYFIAHSLKHFLGAGTGLRNLIDIHYFLQKEGESLDWEYIRSELTRMPSTDHIRVDTYEKALRGLDEKLLCKEWKDITEAIQGLTPIEKILLDSLLTDGTYGSKEKELNRLMEKYTGDDKYTFLSKIVYFRNRLFPDFEWYKANAPYCYDHPWAIPLFTIKRVIMGMANVKRIWKEVVWIIHK